MTDEPRQPAEGLDAVVRRLDMRAVPDVDADPDELRRRREREDRWRLRIPPRFQGARLHDVQDAATRQALEDWASGAPRTNLLLLGPVGVGKTHAAVGVLRVVHEHEWSIAFAPIVEALDWLRPNGPDDAFNALARPRVLVLDDLGGERPTDWTAERLYAVVNRRWLDNKATVATSNLKPDELRQVLDERLYSRLVHGATAVALTGPDRRRS